MKLSKTGWLVIITGVFIIALVGLRVVLYQQVNEQNQLGGKLALVQSRLAGIQPEELSCRQAELEEQLTQVTSQSEAIKAMLSQPIESVAVSGILFDIAEAHGLEVTQMTSSSPTGQSLEGITCSVTSLRATVEGDLPDLVNFVTRMNAYLVTGFIESITITIPEATSDGEASADIRLVVYTYQGE